MSVETSPQLEALGKRWQFEKSPQLAQQLADEHKRLGNLDEAILVLGEASELAPRHLGTRVALGRLLVDAARYDGAAAVLEEVVKSDPVHLVANKLLVRTYAGLGRLAEAREKLDIYEMLSLGDEDVEELRAAIAGQQEVAAADDASPLEAPAAPEDPALESVTPSAESDIVPIAQVLGDLAESAAESSGDDGIDGFFATAAADEEAAAPFAFELEPTAAPAPASEAPPEAALEAPVEAAADEPFGNVFESGWAAETEVENGVGIETPVFAPDPVPEFQLETPAGAGQGSAPPAGAEPSISELPFGSETPRPGAGAITADDLIPRTAAESVGDSATAPDPAATAGTPTGTPAGTGDDPSVPGTVTLGGLYLDQGHRTDAAEIFEDVLTREPGNRKARRGWLAASEAESGESAGGADRFRRVLVAYRAQIRRAVEAGI